MDPTTQIPVQENSAPAAPDLSQEQMKANLQELFSKVESKYQQFNSQKFASNNKMDQMTKDALKEVFDQMLSMGIDPSNVDQVNAFLNNLKSQNPELYDLFESTLNGLLGDAQTADSSSVDIEPQQNEIPPSPVVPPTQNNMNMNSNELPTQTV